MRKLPAVIILSLLPMMTGSSQSILSDTSGRKEFHQKQKILDSLQVQRKVGLDLLEFTIDQEKDSLPKK